MSAVQRYLAGRGWATTVGDLSELGDSLCRVRRVRRPRRGLPVETSVDVAPQIREMMLIELMSASALVNLVEALFDAVDVDPKILSAQTAVVPGDERGTWGLV